LVHLVQCGSWWSFAAAGKAVEGGFRDSTALQPDLDIEEVAGRVDLGFLHQG
jgi:hypothetical protein